MGFFTERELFILIGAAVGIIGYLLISDFIGRRRKARREREESDSEPGADR